MKLVMFKAAPTMAVDTAPGAFLWTILGIKADILREIKKLQPLVENFNNLKKYRKKQLLGAGTKNAY
jgi:hypothetical protein